MRFRVSCLGCEHIGHQLLQLRHSTISDGSAARLRIEAESPRWWPPPGTPHDSSALATDMALRIKKDNPAEEAKKAELDMKKEERAKKKEAKEKAAA